MRGLSLLLLLFPATYAQSQNSVDLRTDYLPGRAYHVVTVQKADLLIKLDSSTQEVLDAMKARGLTNPTAKNMILTGVFDTYVGKPMNGSKSPLKIDIDSSIEISGKVTVPGGTELFGSVAPGEDLKIDSATGPDPVHSEIEQKSMSSLFDQLRLPRAEISTGQSFTADNPIQLPIPGMRATLIMHVTYTLVNVFEGMANLTMVMTISLQTESSGMAFPMTATGSGTGTMVYDVNRHFPVDLEMKYNIDLRMAAGGMVMHVSGGNDDSIKTTISTSATKSSQ